MMCQTIISPIIQIQRYTYNISWLLFFSIHVDHMQLWDVSVFLAVVVIYSNEYGMLQPTLFFIATILFNSYSMFVHIQQPSLIRRLMESFGVHALM